MMIRLLLLFSSSIMPPLEKHYRIILDSIADGVFTVDMNWKITSFNKAAENITGITKKEAIGKQCSKVFRADVCENGCILRHTIKTEKPVVNMPVHIIRADKKSIPISVNTTLLRNDEGRVIGGVETFRDLLDVNKSRRVILKQQSFSEPLYRSIQSFNREKDCRCDSRSTGSIHALRLAGKCS